MQPPPPSRRNRGLFARSSLDRLREADDSTGPDDTLEEAHAALSDLWSRVREYGPPRSTADVATTLVRPVLEALGHPIAPAGVAQNSGTAGEPVAHSELGRPSQSPPANGTPRSRPDLTISSTGGPSPGCGGSSECNGGDSESAAADRAVLIVDVYRWGRRFDAFGDEHSDRAGELPVARVDDHLDSSAARWAILTDGRRWRLVHDESSHRLDRYYEIDLECALEADDLGAFREFYRLFRHTAFRDRGDGQSPLDALADERRTVAERTVMALEANVSRAIESIARDAIDRSAVRSDAGDVGPDVLETHFERALVTVYRLLVCRFAEQRSDPAPVGADPNGERTHSSLDGLARRLAEVLEDAGDVSSHFSSRADCDPDVVAHLETAINQIDDEAFRGVGYDGWLFGTCETPDVTEPDASVPVDFDVQDVGDDALARALVLVTHARDDGENRRPIDYASLEARHLGRLYERLLECGLAVATEPFAREDGAYVPADDGAEVVVEAGEVYLATDEGARKATGAYYTPTDVVSYVVDHTLSPLFAVSYANRQGRDGVTASVESATTAEAVFDRRILDPAMGCGTFLERALEVLTREVVRRQERVAARGGLEALESTRGVQCVRRRLATECLYGVDLDPIAVEIARATLWLRTFGADAGSSTGFESRLRAGNALVGIGLETGLGDDVDELASDCEDGMPVHRDRLEAIANVHTARRFGLESVPDDAVERLADSIADDDVWRRVRRRDWFETAQEWATADRYLHWGLAYPELRSSEGDRSPTMGFDAIIGNPPWVATAGRADVSARMDGRLRSYLADAFETTANQFDLYVAFLERSIRLSSEGRVGFVLPDALLAREGNAPIRGFVCDRTSPERIVRLGAVFDGVETGVVVLVTDDDRERVACADATDRDDLTGLSYTDVPVTAFESRPATRFLVALEDDTRSILEWVDSHPPLEALVEIGRGEEIGKGASILESEPRDGLRPIAPGCAITPYGLDESELRYVDPADVEKDERQYRSPKLLVRQTGDALVGTYDAADLVAIKSAYTIRPTSDSPTDDRLLKHVLGVLSSPLLNYYHHYVYAAYRAVFPQINQSTLERLPLSIGDGPDATLVDAVADRLALTAARASIELDFLEYLVEQGTEPTSRPVDEPSADGGDGAPRVDVEGPRLGDLECCRLEPSADETLLTETAETVPSLRIGSVEVTRRADAVALAVRLRYKPDDAASPRQWDGPVETDRWGFASTPPVPAMRFPSPDETVARLLEAFVPRAVDEGEGFAGFRVRATRTRSPLERLRSLRLPRPTAVREPLEAFQTASERAADLEARIATLDRTIHERVCTLYGVPPDEREIVWQEFGSENES